MKKAIDPGFGEKYANRTKRIINPDGTFNVVRRNTGFSFRDVYQYLISLPWTSFLGLVVLFYGLVNLIFTACYYLTGIQHISGLPAGSDLNRFLNVYFFSVQTFTTVGYGVLAPVGIPANILASLEAMSGWLFFALATGLLYGRFSRPTSRILFSRNALIVPGENYNRLMFRIVNQRSNIIVELEAKVILMFVNRSEGKHNREYYTLNLERSGVSFFPMNWTLVHEIDPESPLYGKSAAQLAERDTEIIILLKGYNDTFKQTLHTRYSYRFNEFVWGAKFRRAYELDESGTIILDMNWLHEFEEANLNNENPEPPQPNDMEKS